MQKRMTIKSLARVEDSNGSLSSPPQLHHKYVLFMEGRIMGSEENAELSRDCVNCLLFLGIHLEGLTAAPLPTGSCSPDGS